MKKYDVEQDFVFTAQVRMSVKDKDYDTAMQKAVAELNSINDGEVKIEEIKGEHHCLRI